MCEMDHHSRSEAIGFFNHCAPDFLFDYKICTIFCVVLCLSTILFVNFFFDYRIPNNRCQSIQ